MKNNQKSILKIILPTTSGVQGWGQVVSQCRAAPHSSSAPAATATATTATRVAELLMLPIRLAGRHPTSVGTPDSSAAAGGLRRVQGNQLYKMALALPLCFSFLSLLKPDDYQMF